MSKTKRNLIIVAAFLIPMLLGGIVVMPLTLFVYFLVFFISVNTPLIPALSLLLSGPLLLSLLPHLILKRGGIRTSWPLLLSLLSFFLNIFAFFFFMYLLKWIDTGRLTWPL